MAIVSLVTQKRYILIVEERPMRTLMLNLLVLIVFLASSIQAKDSSMSGQILFVFEKSISEGIFFPSLFAMLAGMLTVLSPCVYPLIPITLTVMGARRYASIAQGFLVSLSYVLGMSIVYTSLGSIFAFFGMLLGSLLQHPAVILIIALIFLAFSLSMFGVFNLVLPPSLMNRLSKVGGNGIKGSFLMGMVAGLIATPCTGPVLGAILTIIASRSDMGFGVSLMLFFSLGMGLPFLLLGTFSQAINRMPKSGKWMTGVKYVLASSMLVISFYYFSLATGFFNNAPLVASDSEQLSFYTIDQTNSVRSFDDLLQRAQKHNLPVMIDFFADWCSACHQLEKITFKDKQVINKLEKFLLIRVDSTKSSDDLDIIQKRFGITGLPTIIFFDQKGKLSDNKVLGFLKPKHFLQALEKLSYK